MIARIFKYFDGLHAGGQADGEISKEEWITAFATFIKGDPSYSLSSPSHSTLIENYAHCHYHHLHQIIVMTSMIIKISCAAIWSIRWKQ